MLALRKERMQRGYDDPMTREANDRATEEHYLEAEAMEPDDTSLAFALGGLLASLIHNVLTGASYALGALLVWDLFFR